MNKNIQNKIIVALDNPNIFQQTEIVEKLGGKINLIKN